MISINATLIVQVINFLILVYILNWVLFKPIFKIIGEREERVNNYGSEAERLKTASDEKIASFESQIRETRAANRKLRQEAKKQANAAASEIIDKARVDARRHVIAIREQSSLEAQRVSQELEDYSRSIVQSVFAKVMGREAV